MLFNKKAEEELLNNLAAAGKRAASAAPSAVEPAAAALRKSNGAPTRSVIDAWLRINGNLESEGEVQVDGQIQGDIRCAHLTVGRDALVNGNITADEVVVRGKVMGCIRGNRVILQDCAHVRERGVPQEALDRGGRLLRGHVPTLRRPAKCRVAGDQAGQQGQRQVS